MESRHSNLPPIPAEAEVLYLPNGTAINQLSVGYRNLFGDLLWFRTISYFGEHFRGDKNYQWLYHMCSLVTDLDPGAQHVYSFCSTMLAWEAKAVDTSIALLTKAITQSPRNWVYYYLRGFNYLYFKKDSSHAREDFISASRLPSAHPLVAELASKTTTQLESKDIAIQLLKSFIAEASDPAVREAFIKKLKELEQ